MIKELTLKEVAEKYIKKYEKEHKKGYGSLSLTIEQWPLDEEEQ